MTIYVDDVRHKFGRMIMCHMWSSRIGADGRYGEDLDELMAMADHVGVARKWIQGHAELSIGTAKSASWLHFDVALGAKDKSIAAGAVLTDRYGPLEHCLRLGRRSALTIAQVQRYRAKYGLPADGIIARTP